jgi:hypothetical protein
MVCTPRPQEREQRPCPRVDMVSPLIGSGRVEVGEGSGGWRRRGLRRGRVMELHGEAFFAGPESVVRDLSELDEKVEIVVPDLTCGHRLAPVGFRLLSAIRAARAQAGANWQPSTRRSSPRTSGP